MVALGREGAAAAQIGVVVQRVDLECLVVVCDCQVDFALRSVECSATRARVEVGGITITAEKNDNEEGSVSTNGANDPPAGKQMQ